MNIKGLDYNTQRERLVMGEYGREVQKMVALAIGLPTKEERNRCAQTIIKLMESKNPQPKGNADHERTLWDHLYLISHKQLDIDWPYDVSEAERIHARPEPMKLPDHRIELRHYGRLVGQLLKELKTMEDGPAKEALVSRTANQMKRDLVNWGHGSMDNERVANDLARFTDGAVQLDLSTFKFEKVTAAEPKPAKKKK